MRITPNETEPSGGEPAQRPVRVLVVDDHPMVRDIIRLVCTGRPALEVVGEAGTGVEALRKCRELDPDVLVLDLSLPGLDGFEVIRRLRSEGSTVRILVISGRGDRTAVFESLRHGADGFFEKAGSVADIAASIEAVAEGTQVITIEHQRVVHQELARLARRSREAARIVSSLTPRERQTLFLIARGLSTRQVASELKVTERTIESHVGSLYRKLGVRSRVQAMHMAATLDLIDVDKMAWKMDAVGDHGQKD